MKDEKNESDERSLEPSGLEAEETLELRILQDCVRLIDSHSQLIDLSQVMMDLRTMNNELFIEVINDEIIKKLIKEKNELPLK